MRYLERIEHYAAVQPDAPAIRTSSGARMTYRELWQASEALAEHLARDGRDGPVIVYGHKEPLIVACFLACMKAGRPYVPLDRHSVPTARVNAIASQLGDPELLAVSALPECPFTGPSHVHSRASLEGVVACAGGCADSDRERWIDAEDLCYILFTSGSTGDPKGVEITASCFDNFCAWAERLGEEPRPGRVYLDQAPFSFDLSVYELACALATGGSLYCLEHDAQQSARRKLEALGSSGVNVWVSTPSFADTCLASAEFDAGLLQGLELMIFCGETLANATAGRLLERFPGVEVLNTYGPTESTVAVTQVRVTPAMCAADEPLPVGAARPGTRIRILDDDGAEVPAGAYGEVVIEGDTVALGYYGRPDLTAAVFGSADLDGRAVRTYRTGDEGSLDDAGMLRYRGRIDLQVKLNGYRIELGEIEEALRRLPGVAGAAVTMVRRDGRLSHLVAHVVSDGPVGESDFRAGLALKDRLKEVLPHYMVPKKIEFLSALPVTGNGKIDRRALMGGGR